MKVIAIILLVLQAMSLYGSISSGQFGIMMAQATMGGVAGISQLVGYFLPAIIAVILLNKHSKKQDEENGWVCPHCDTPNPKSIKVCKNCGNRQE